MVEGRLSLEQEVQEIFLHIDKGRNFLLSGGAGSGKTYSLVSVIRQVIAEYPTAKVACMTYTNAAVKEIEERVNHKNLNVSTIHDFLWDNIKHFQKELKEALLDINNKNESDNFIDGGNGGDGISFDNLEEGIQYKEFTKIREGIISHDEVLTVANYLFEKYPKLSDIVKDKYKFIFIDEYQDTSRLVVEIFLEHFTKSKKKNIIGFFGDAMQSIYDGSIGNLDDYKGEEGDKVKEVKKHQNRRNPQKIINLANKIRTDGIEQTPSTDNKAPNMLNGVVQQGNALFLYSTNQDVERAKKYLTDNYNWDFSNSKETKELNLTHNLIAKKAGFGVLMAIYDRDPILDLKNDILKKIKENKKKNKIEIIEILDEDTFDAVVDKFQLKNKGKKLKKSVLLEDPVNELLYNQLKDKPFSEVKKIYVTKEALLDDKKQDEDDENKKGSKRDNLIKHLFKIQTNIFLYKNGRINEFLRATDYGRKILKISDKRTLKKKIEELINTGDKTIEEVINDAHEKEICLIDDKLEAFKEKSEYLYNRVKDIKFSEFQKLYQYLEGQTPFSTQHKIKGSEFDNVLVILDNGQWTKYNFESPFLNHDKESVLKRTQKIFYVCCTRAKKYLAVFFHNPNSQIIDKAKEWFGDSNVISIDSVGATK